MIIDGQAYGANGTSARAPTSALTSDFNTFLRMLTVQMQNQDPLNPMAASDFAVQLATFSQVEQQVRANDLLSGLGTQISELGLSQLGSWIGLEARVAAPVTLTGQPVELAFATDPSAESSAIVVKTMSGAEVQRIHVALGQQSQIWAADGLAAGTYQLELVNFAQGKAISRSAVEHYAKVSEASSQAGGVTLTLATGTSVAAGAVSSYRAPKG